MCGIVGLISIHKNGPSAEEMGTFRDMLVFDSVRGFDSTGVFGVHKNGNVEMAKAAITGSEFVTTYDYKDWHGNMYMSGQMLVGHNRAATRGTINDANAHPFCIDDKILLVQNGTYKGSHHHLANTNVDSEAIATLLAREDNVETALQQVDAAFALVWYNVPNQTLNIIRNDERPLYIANTKEGSILFASEPNFVMCAAYRNGVELEKPPYLLKEYNLVTIKFTHGSNVPWELDNVVGDYKFRPSVDKTYSEFRQQYSNWYHAFSDLQFDDGTQPPEEHWSKKPGASNLQIDKVAVEIALNGNFSMTDNEAANEAKICSNRPTGKPALVRLLDWLPANQHKECTCWWVYGEKVNASDDSPSPIFYKIIHDKTEAEIKSIVDEQEYFWCTTSTARSIKVGSKGNTDVFVVTTYVAEMEEACETIATQKPH